MELFSERLQCTVVLLRAFYEHRCEGVLFTAPEISRVTGLSRTRTNDALSVCYRTGVLTTDSRNSIVAGRNFESLTLPELIAECDGWIHIGNAARSSLHYGNNPYSVYLKNIEEKIYEQLYSSLSSVRVAELAAQGTGDTVIPGLLDSTA